MSKSSIRLLTSDEAEAHRQQPIDRAYQALVDGAPLTVKISRKPREVAQHELSSMFPLLSREEFGELVADVEAHGFREPITLTADGTQVLEGRHRCAVSMATGISLNKPRLFDGSDDEARDLVASANLLRRHMSAAQRALMVREVYLSEAATAARKRMLSGKDSAGVHKGRASAVAAERAGGIVSARSVDALAIVDKAPHTAEKIRTGKISSVTAAVREAQREIGETPATKRTSKAKGGRGNGRSVPFREVRKSADDGIARYVSRLEDGREVGRLDILAERARIDEWRTLLLKAEAALDTLEVAK